MNSARTAGAAVAAKGRMTRSRRSTRSGGAPQAGGRREPREIVRGLLQRLAIFADEARAELRGGRHVIDAADTLAGGPDVLPCALFLLTDLDVLLRRLKVDLGAGGVDAGFEEVAGDAADRRRVDDVLGAA